jgi:molecular chaperone HscA
VNAQGLIEATRNAMRTDGDLLQAEQRQAIEQALAAVEQAIAGGKTRDINEYVSQLNLITEPFAGQRMDRNVRRALKGQNIGEL